MAVLTAPNAAAYLRIENSDKHDVLEEMCSAAQAAIEARVGPLEPEAVTARVEGGGSVLFLPKTPAISLTSITPLGGAALTVADYWVSTGGTVRRNTTGYTFTEDWYDVAYQAGFNPLPDDLLLAVKELVRHFWSTQRGGTQRPGSTPSDMLSNSIPGFAYTFPHRVSELIAPYELPGGFA